LSISRENLAKPANSLNAIKTNNTKYIHKYDLSEADDPIPESTKG
jgi:hypothetical protein